MGTSGSDFNRQSNIATSVSFTLAVGGYYMVKALATWGGGNLHLQTLLDDGATYIDVGSGTDFTANGVAFVYLAPGIYQWTVTTATAVYCSVTRIPLG